VDPYDIVRVEDIVMLQQNLLGTRPNIVTGKDIVIAHIVISSFYCTPGRHGGTCRRRTRVQ
jgi:hypothetical protein